MARSACGGESGRWNPQAFDGIIEGRGFCSYICLSSMKRRNLHIPAREISRDPTNSRLEELIGILAEEDLTSLLEEANRNPSRRRCRQVLRQIDLCSGLRNEKEPVAWLQDGFRPREHDSLPP